MCAWASYIELAVFCSWWFGPGGGGAYENGNYGIMINCLRPQFECDAISLGVALVEWEREFSFYYQKEEGTSDSFKPFPCDICLNKLNCQGFIGVLPVRNWQLSRSSTYFGEDFLNVFQCCRWHFARRAVVLRRIEEWKRIKKEYTHRAEKNLPLIYSRFMGSVYSIGNFYPPNIPTKRDIWMHEERPYLIWANLLAFIGFA